MGGLAHQRHSNTRGRASRLALTLIAALALLILATGSGARPASAFESSNSHLTIWGPNALKPSAAGGPVTATARLVDFTPETRGRPLPGRTITFSLGNATQTAVTNGSGEASATFNYASGQSDVIVALFAGDGAFGPSMDRGWLRGDIVVGVGRGMAHRYDSTGTFVNIFDSTTGSLETAGMCFDSDRNLYLVSFQVRVISKFNRSTGEVIPRWAEGFSRSPESCVLGREDLDGDGVMDDVIYAGEQDGQNDIRKFNTSGDLLAIYNVASGNRGADWIDLATGGTTVRYTSEGSEIFAFDLVNNTQLPSFVPDQSVPGNQLVPRGDSRPRNAIDGNPDTSWVTNDGHVRNQFITIDLTGGIQAINRIYIEGHSETTAVKNFQLQVSTAGTADTDFTTVFTGVSPRDTKGQQFGFNPVNARFVRLIAVDNYGSAIHLRIDELRIFNTSGENVAAEAGGASIAATSSIQRDPLLPKPCFALRNRPDDSALVTCASEVALVSANGLEALRRYPRAALGFDATDTIYGLNLGLDGESFWASTQIGGRVAHVDVETGAVLHSFAVQKRGPTVGGIAIFGEPTEGVDYEPTAHSQVVFAEPGQPLLITLTGDDPESEPLTFTVINPPDHGHLTGTAPHLTYRSEPGFMGTDSLTFLAYDGTLYSTPATVTIHVLLPGSALAGGPYTVTEGGTVILEGASAGGGAALFEWDLDGDGVFGETGAAAANGDETGLAPVFSAASLDGPAEVTVTLRVTGENGATSTAQASIAVTNAVPDVSIAGFAIAADGAASLSVIFTDPAAADTHSAVVDWGDGSPPEPLGAVTSPFTATHTYPATGTYTATVTVTDDDGGSGAAEAAAEVGGAGSASAIAFSQSVSVMRDSSVEITLAGIGGDFGPEGRLVFNISSQPSHGVLSPIFHASASTALVIYEPDEGFTGQDSFNFTVSDADETSAPALVNITVFVPSSGGGGSGAGAPAPTSTPSSGGNGGGIPPSELLFVTAAPGDRAVTLSWSPPASDGGSPVVGYRILVLNTAEVRFVLAPALATTITGLENGEPYAFQLQAFNAAGYGPSVIAGPVTPFGRATAPLGVHASLAGPASVMVTWSAPDSDGGSPVTGYIVELDDATEMASVSGGAAFSARLDALEPGRSYSFVVTAVTAAGRGEPSAPSEPLFLPPLAGAPDDPPPTAEATPATPEPSTATALPPTPTPAAAPSPTAMAVGTPLPGQVEMVPFTMVEVEREREMPWLVLGLATAGMLTATGLALRLLSTGIPGMPKR